MQIKFERIFDHAVVPTKTHTDDACWDLYAAQNIWIKPREVHAVETGLKFEIPSGSALQVYARSGLAAKDAISVYNAPGVIDAGYVGELKVILYNGGNKDFYVTMGMKIAQFRRVEILDDELVEDVVNVETERGEAGFGSTDLPQGNVE